MSEIFQNSRFTGIGGGIISGFIVYVVTNRINSRNNNREYNQKVRQANSELLHIIRPLLVEKKDLNSDIIKSIIESVTRKYKVNHKDIVKTESILNDIIREIMENPFLDNNKKVEYSEFLSILITKRDIQNDSSYIDDRYSNIYNKDISLILSLVAFGSVFASMTIITKDYGVYLNLGSILLDYMTQVEFLIASSIILPISAFILEKIIRENRTKIVNNKYFNIFNDLLEK